MLKIRFARVGRKKLPRYRLVVTEHSRKLKGRFLEVLGWYNPTGEKDFSINKERVEEWLAKGAQPSDSAARLLNRAGFNFEVKQKPPRPPRKKEGAKEPKAESKVEAAAEEQKEEAERPAAKEPEKVAEVAPKGEAGKEKVEPEKRGEIAPPSSESKGAPQRFKPSPSGGETAREPEKEEGSSK